MKGVDRTPASYGDTVGPAWRSYVCAAIHRTGADTAKLLGERPFDKGDRGDRGNDATLLNSRGSGRARTLLNLAFTKPTNPDLPCCGSPQEPGGHGVHVTSAALTGTTARNTIFAHTGAPARRTLLGRPTFVTSPSARGGCGSRVAVTSRRKRARGLASSIPEEVREPGSSSNGLTGADGAL